VSVIDGIPLRDIQGNILKGFDKPNVRLVLLKFNDDIAKYPKNDNQVREWLSSMHKRLISTEELLKVDRQRHERQESDPHYESQDVFLHVSFSYSGIVKLKLPPPPSTGVYSGLGNHSEIEQPKLLPKDAFQSDAISLRLYPPGDPFSEGMRRRAGILGDGSSAGSHVEARNDPKNWDEPYKSFEIDALFLVAADQEDDLDSYSSRLISEATRLGNPCIGLEIGKAIKNEQGKQVEHFGFRDGISQPLIEGIDTAGGDNYPNLLHPKDFILFGLEDQQDRKLSWANNGSFLVFRKLEQDVEGFWKFMTEKSQQLRDREMRKPAFLAKDPGRVEISPEELAAKIMGRWKSGAPLVEGSYDPVDPCYSDRNDFSYVSNKVGATGPSCEDEVEKKVAVIDDPEGRITPLFAHIRVTNRRDSQGEDWTMGSPEANMKENNRHRILRRGIPYGPQWAEKKTRKEQRGLLFMCYQRDIAQQFEYIQTNWFKTQGFAGPHNDILFLLKDGYDRPGIESWVTTKGGGYFFSPSISSIKNLTRYAME
jgi:Dyp-type peroxidase family